ncbi:MAG: zinc carboxypeptidase [Flavobacteriaceae bacterium]|nr:MAG: zinc carboxypeptidase [Flavobacteriaceae bacterium]
MTRIQSLILFMALTVVSVLTAQSIKSPSEYFGHEIGSQFHSNHKIVDYFNYLDSNSSAVLYKKYGETTEIRELTYAIISSEENIKNIEHIRKNNILNSQNKATTTPEIAIVWMSYNVHGNEASSSEAAMETAYQLITNRQELLKNTVVILDPCLNPDGRDRYVNWYNQVKTTPYNTDPLATEHNEPWPSGRPNHYLFDLNRDWAWATQIETQQRLKVYLQWMPHVHVDFHEQFFNEPYYFAPAAEPFHEIITDWQREFQHCIGANNSKQFDQNGWLYFTKQFFDLLYPSYGDTYPTFMGAVGMTFEQAGHGKAGLGVQTDEGFVLTLKDRVAHHTATGISTVEMSAKHALRLNTEFAEFFKPDQQRTYNSYILKGNKDKVNRLVDFLAIHNIKSYTGSTSTLKGFDYTSQKNIKYTLKNDDVIVPVNQVNTNMIKALLEPESKLSDSVTYDSTAWSLPYAHGVEAIAGTKTFNIANLQAFKTSDNNADFKEDAYGYIAKWNHVSDAEFMTALLIKNIKVRYTTKPITVADKLFKEGTLLLLKRDNKHLKDFNKILKSMSTRFNKKLVATNSGLVQKGPDFGSQSIHLVGNKKIALLSGKETSSLSFGEIWHFFEQQLKYPITIIKGNQLDSKSLRDFDVLIIPNGYYGSLLAKTTLETLKSWVSDGGKLITIGTALNPFATSDAFNLSNKKNAVKKDSINLTPYNQIEREEISETITGAIFKATIDNTHPLGFGYGNDYFSLKLGADTFNLLSEGYNVGYFDKTPSKYIGFAGNKAVKNIPNSLLFGVEPIGNGQIIYMVNNPLFRQFWENGKLFMVNAVFFK